MCVSIQPLPSYTNTPHLVTTHKKYFQLQPIMLGTMRIITFHPLKNSTNTHFLVSLDYTILNDIYYTKLYILPSLSLYKLWKKYALVN